MTADPSQYGLLGARLNAELDWGTAVLSGRYGAALAGSEGRWIQGDASLVTGGRIGRLGARLLASGYGLRYLDPFTYEAGGVQLRPSLSLPVGSFIVSALPRASYGRWVTETVEGDLRAAGGDVEVQRWFGPLRAVVSAGAADVENGVARGTFAEVGGDLTLDRGLWNAGVTVKAQRTPLEDELGGGVRLSLMLSPGFQIHAYGGRRVRDPLFGTAGSVAFSVSATVRTARWSPPRPPPVVDIGDVADGGRRVAFSLRAPDAGTVALTGDFTDWQPVPMEEAGAGWWRVSRVVPPGLHHFGFLVDGQWAIPPDAPGVVEDGWGRQNASIIVEL